MLSGAIHFTGRRACQSNPLVTLGLILFPHPGKPTSSCTHIALDDVVGVVHDVPSQAEVPNFGHMPIGEQHISGCHIPVDALWGEDVVT